MSDDVMNERIDAFKTAAAQMADYLVTRVQLEDSDLYDKALQTVGEGGALEVAFIFGAPEVVLRVRDLAGYPRTVCTVPLIGRVMQ